MVWSKYNKKILKRIEASLNQLETFCELWFLMIVCLLMKQTQILGQIRNHLTYEVWRWGYWDLCLCSAVTSVLHTWQSTWSTCSVNLKIIFLVDIHVTFLDIYNHLHICPWELHWQILPEQSLWELSESTSSLLCSLLLTESRSGCYWWSSWSWSGTINWTHWWSLLLLLLLGHQQPTHTCHTSIIMYNFCKMKTKYSKL